MNHATAAAKIASFVVVLTGGIAMGLAPDSYSVAKDLFEIILSLAAIVGVAYVMKSDVAALKKWAWGEPGGAESRLRATESNTKVVSELLETHDNRLNRIERHEDEK